MKKILELDFVEQAALVIGTILSVMLIPLIFLSGAVASGVLGTLTLIGLAVAIYECGKGVGAAAAYRKVGYRHSSLYGWVTPEEQKQHFGSSEYNS